MEEPYTVLSFKKLNPRSRRVEFFWLYKKTYEINRDEREKYKFEPEEIITNYFKGKKNGWSMKQTVVKSEMPEFFVIETQHITWDPFDFTTIPEEVVTRRKEYFERKNKWKQPVD